MPYGLDSQPGGRACAWGLALALGLGLAGAASAAPLAQPPAAQSASAPLLPHADPADDAAQAAGAEADVSSRVLSGAAATGRSAVGESREFHSVESDWARSSFKELAGATGVLDAWQSLGDEMHGGKVDAVLDGDTDPARATRRGAETADGEDGHPAISNPARSDEQRKLDDVRAAFLFAKLVDEVKPWLIAAVVCYVLVYGARLLLAYSRVRAERKRKRRLKRSSRSRSTRLE